MILAMEVASVEATSANPLMIPVINSTTSHAADFKASIKTWKLRFWSRVRLDARFPINMAAEFSASNAPMLSARALIDSDNATMTGVRGARIAAATPRAVNAPATARSAMPISVRLSEPSSFIAGTSRFTAAAIVVSATAAPRVPFARFNASTKTPILAPAVVSAFPISVQFISPKLLKADTNRFMLPASIKNAAPFPMPNFTPFISFAAKTRTAVIPDIPPSPFAISSSFRPLSALSAVVRISPAAPFRNLTSSLESTAPTIVSPAITPPSAATLARRLLLSMVEMTFSAPDSTRTADETAIIPVLTAISFKELTSFEMSASAFITPSSPRNTPVIASIEALSRSGFIIDTTASDAAMIPIDFAIVISVSDFFASFHASIASPSESIVSLMPPIIPFALSPTDLIPSRKLFTEARIPTLNPPVIKSFILSGSKLLKASFAPFAKLENTTSASFPKE